MDEKQPKNGNGYPVLHHPVVRAIRARAPEMGRDGWYSEIADAIGASDGAVKNWFYGKNLPDIDNLDALKRHFGVEFADEIEQAATGFRVVLGPDEQARRIAHMERHARAMLDEKGRAG